MCANRQTFVSEPDKILPSTLLSAHSVALPVAKLNIWNPILINESKRV